MPTAKPRPKRPRPATGTEGPAHRRAALRSARRLDIRALRGSLRGVTRPPVPAHRLLAAVPLFHDLGAATLKRLSETATRRALKRGERVFSKGDVLTGMYVLVYGEVRLVSATARGKRLTGVVRPGHSFGEPMMFLDRPAPVDAQAVSDTLLLHVPRQAVFDELERDPAFARRIIAGLCRRLEAMVMDAERRAVPGGRDRLIAYLARSAREHDGAALVELPAAKAEVASHLHLTPEHFSRLLHELAADGLVQVKARRIAIPDLGRLVASAAGPRPEPPAAG